MIWKIDFDSDVEKDLRKLGATAQKRILTFLKKKIATTDDPRAYGKALTGDFSGLCRYGVSDYRIISKIEDNVFTVLVVKVGHREEIYD